MKAILVTLAFLFTSVICFCQQVTGVFKSDFNELMINQNGSKITGTYKHQNGRIEGTLNGRTITGRWYQSNGKGKFVFEFHADYSGFTGKWSYNDAEPNQQWNGTRIGGGPPTSGLVEVTLGVYNSDFKELTMSRNGNQVTGTYKHQNGRIEGTLSGRTLTGRWYQSNGKGRFVFEFNADFSAFTGKWSYNDAEPNQQWNGKRISGGPPPPSDLVEVTLGVYNSDFKELTMSRNGNQVTGTYKHQNGRIEGTLSGRTLTGRWYQSNGKGRFVFEFNADFSAFTGKWNYNDAEPNQRWNGTRIATSAALPVNKPAAAVQPAKTPQTPSQAPASSAPSGTTGRLNVSLRNTKAVVGDLGAGGIRLSIPEKAFDQNVSLEVREPATAPQFDQKRAALLGKPFEITISQQVKRLNKPVTVQARVSPQELARLEHRGDLWMAYHNGKEWNYFKPDEVNPGAGYVSFTTFHFSLFAKAAPTKAERISDFAYRTAVTQWVGEDNNQLTRQATEQMVEQILRKNMGVDNKSLAQDVVEAIMNENDYTKLLVSLNDERMDDFGQDLAVLAGEKICDIVSSESNAKELLGTITEHSSKIGTAVQMAAALSEGDTEGAAKALATEILSSYPVVTAFQKAAEITERQINRWRDEELEAAYQVFVHGAESGVPWWGYQVEPGNFDQVWAQMRGLEAKLMDDAIKQEAARQKVDVNMLGDVWLDKIRRDTKETFRQEFQKRQAQEGRIVTIKADNEKLIREFEQANLLARDRFGFTDATTFDFRLERLFRLKDMVLKDTGSRLGFSGANGGGVISSATVAHLVQLWYSENGKEKYRQELVRLGYKKSEKSAAVAAAKPPVPSAGGELEGVWVGSITHTPMYDDWGNPAFDWLEGANSTPLMVLIYRVGAQYRGLSYTVPGWYFGGLRTLRDAFNTTPNILEMFKNGRMEARKDFSAGYKPDGTANTAYWIWKATRLRTPVSPAIFPDNVSIPSLEKASSEYIKAAARKAENLAADAGHGERVTRAKMGEAAQRIEATREYYARTSAFQRAAEIWLKQRKFKTDRRTDEENEIWDRVAFEELFKSLQ